MKSTASTVPAAAATVGGKGLRSGVLGLTGSMVIAASSVAPAYSLAAALAGMVAAVGAKTPALFVIGFIPMMLTAFAFRELANQTPDCGTTFTWTTRAFGPWVGWLAGWAAMIAAIVAVGNGAQIAAIYLLEALHLNVAATSMTAQIAVGGLAVVVLVVLLTAGRGHLHRHQQLSQSMDVARRDIVLARALRFAGPTGRSGRGRRGEGVAVIGTFPSRAALAGPAAQRGGRCGGVPGRGGGAVAHRASGSWHDGAVDGLERPVGGVDRSGAAFVLRGPLAAADVHRAHHRRC